MLGEQLARHNVNCYLVNTGWIGGAFGVGERMSLKYTRAMVNAAIAGELDNVRRRTASGVSRSGSEERAGRSIGTSRRSRAMEG